MSEFDGADAEPKTPAEMARELGVGAKKVREVLRELYPRDEAEHGDAWYLEPPQQAALRTRIAPVGVEGSGREWAQFAELAAGVLDAGFADSRSGELEYKEAIRAGVRAVRTACERDDDEWVDALRALFRPPNNLVDYRTVGTFMDAVERDRDLARAALMQLWASAGDGRAVDDFRNWLTRSDSDLHPGGVVAVASTLLLASMDSAPYKSRAAERFAKRVGVRLQADASDCGGRWEEFLSLVDRSREVLAGHGVSVADRLEAQSVIWLLSEWPVEDVATGTLAQRLRSWRGEDLQYTRANRINRPSEDGAWRFLKAGLLGEPSPLTDAPSVWTAENAREIVKRVFDNPMLGTDKSFNEKLEVQLEGASSDVVQLLAEFQIVRQLPTGGIKLRGAVKALDFYATLASADWEMPDWLVDAFSGHVFGGGNRYNQDQWLHVVLLARLVEQWSEQSEAERAAILASPWEMVEFLETVGGDTSGEKHMRMVVSYLAWPNYFHPIISSDHIRRIRATFANHVTERRGNSNADIQRDLYEIQEALAPGAGGTLSFYASPYVEQWQERKSVAATSVEDEVEGFAVRARTLSDQLYMDAGALGRIGNVLEGRKQVVFYGPPGTGKTYVARALAQELAGEDAEDAVRLVQFHPSYAYEDFFEGFRPVAGEGTATFSLQAGPLRRLASSAKDNPDQPHFLIIDEMNRGNLAKVFGELYFLLEYRDQEVYLQYSPDKAFTLPDNLYIIGTMNTTDRSIGLVDAAIRRRFAFIEFHPEESPVEGVLERYLERNSLDGDHATLMRALNARIGDRDLRIGPSYLMRPSAHEPGGLEDIWAYDVLPLLYEHFHGRKSVDEVRREFALETLRGEQRAEEYRT